MEETQHPDLQFIEFIVKHIVDNPESIKIDRSIDEMGVLITLEVDKQDMGKIIGKSGQTAKALRVLLRVIGSRNNARINLKIVEPEGSDHVRRDSERDSGNNNLGEENENSDDKLIADLDSNDI